MSSQDNTKVLLIDTSEFVVLHNRMNGANGIDGFDEITTRSAGEDWTK